MPFPSLSSSLSSSLARFRAKSPRSTDLLIPVSISMRRFISSSMEAAALLVGMGAKGALGLSFFPPVDASKDNEGIGERNVNIGEAGGESALA